MQTALITGAADRLGRQIAQQFHQNGFNVVIHYCRNAEKAHQLCAQFNQKRARSAHCFGADLAKLDDISSLVDRFAKVHSNLDVLVHNAALFQANKVGETGLNQWQHLTGINFFAPFFLTQALMPYLTGSVVNILDIHSERPLKNYPLYSSVKAALKMLTKSLAMELAPDIRVNAISPGAILWHDAQTDEQKENIVAKIPLQRRGSADDIAKAVYFLSQAPYITGQILSVDGGRNLNQ